MTGRDIVVIGASAGGVEALLQLCQRLPRDLAASLFVVIHHPPESPSALAAILARACPLTVAPAVDGDSIEHGRIYVAVPDRHLLIKNGFVGVVSGPVENLCRPAIDPLFRTAAEIYGPRTIGVLLSGASDDGVSGARAIKTHGGIVVVQNPNEARHPELPRSAIQSVDVDHVHDVDRIAALLSVVTRQPAPPWPDVFDPQLQKEARLAEADLPTIEDDAKVGTPSMFSCPDCGGVLWELDNSDFLRFRCRVGHAYTAAALAEQQGLSLEKALWAAFRSLEESASLARRLAMRARRTGHAPLVERFMRRAEDASANAEAIRQVIMGLDRVKETEVIGG